MGFFSQAGKKKKKGQPGYKEEFQEIAPNAGLPTVPCHFDFGDHGFLFGV